MRVVNIHAAQTDNIGDVSASIVPYLPEVPVEEHDIGNAFPDVTGWFDDSLVIVGGGGLFYRPWQKKLIELCNRTEERKAKGGKLAFWGVGLNHSIMAVDDTFPEAISQADLVGVRDWIPGREWVPGASCLNPVFDKRYDVSQKIVCWWHPVYPVPIYLADAPASDPYSHKSIESAVEFLAQGEYVLTTSYHGAYWATLLGRKVIVWPFSSRFYHMRHAPLLADRTWTLAGLLSAAQSYPQALNECRSANLTFKRKLLTLIGKGETRDATTEPSPEPSVG